MNERGPDPKKNTFYGRPAGAVFLPAIVAVLLSLAFFSCRQARKRPAIRNMPRSLWMLRRV